MRIAQTCRYVKTKVGIVFNHRIATSYKQTALVLYNVLFQYGRQIRVQFFTYEKVFLLNEYQIKTILSNLFKTYPHSR